jgi:8-oxo-dGTP pyrophosphatase MutT (NUDIX family)
MAKHERSAGVVVFRNATDVALDEHSAGELFPDLTTDTEGGGTAQRLYLLLDYGRFWDYPKGHVEKAEDDAAAALRELREETGIDDAQLVPGFAREIAYFFRAGGKGLIRKEVVFFLARTSRRRVTISHEHVGSAWLPFEQAVARLTYPNAKQILREADEFLRTGRITERAPASATPQQPDSSPPRAKVSRSRTRH